MDIENKYNTLERQTELLSMMKDVHHFLVENNISYSLCGGNLLGAVREGGFIPWDDDVDIMMDRENYEKFLKCCNQLQRYKTTRLLWVYRIQKDEPSINPWHISTIDIFVFDNVPDNKLLHKIKVFLIRLLQSMMKKKPKAKNMPFIKRTVLLTAHYFGKLFTTAFKQKLYDSVSKIGNKKTTNCVGCFNGLFHTIDITYNKSLMAKLQLHPYEDTMFYITSDYHSYLLNLYGDYMTPPQEKDRHAPHMN